MTSLAFLERRRGEAWVRTAEATSIELLSNVWVTRKVLFILVGMDPNTPRRISLGVDLSNKAGVSNRWDDRHQSWNARRMDGLRSGRL